MSHFSHVAIGVAALAAAMLSPAVASGAAVHCGQVITHDTTLRNDLVDCPGNGLRIGADGVTLNLGGHLIDGTNAKGSEGIAVDGHARVTIRNGRVRQFRDNGVALRKSPNGRVTHLTVKKIGEGGKAGQPVSAGVLVQGSDGVAIDRNRVSNAVKAYQADGIVVLESKRPRITRNRSSSNAWNGIVVFGSPGTRIEQNRTERNGNSGIFVANAAGATISGNRSNRQKKDDTAGIAVLDTKNATISGNHTSGNAATGIALESGTTGTTVKGNVVQGGGDGIALLECDGNTVQRNQVTGVGGVGIVLDAFGPPDQQVNGSDDNTIDRNEVKSSGLAGILVVGGSDGNALTRNVTNASRGDGAGGDPAGGILIDGATANRLDGNTASKNKANGVRVASPGNTVSGTTALDNLLRGIDAVDGTIDGGGNHASGNGLEPQCTGVACA